jgi:hypothetical protein
LRAPGTAGLAQRLHDGVQVVVRQRVEILVEDLSKESPREVKYM